MISYEREGWREGGREGEIRMDSVQPLSSQQSYATNVIHYGRELSQIKLINERKRQTYGQSLSYAKPYA